MPSTYVVSYLGEDRSEGELEARHKILDDHLMPSIALGLAHSDVYGVEWVYDMGTDELGLSSLLYCGTYNQSQGLITPWRPFSDGLSSTGDYLRVTALPLAKP